MKNSSLVLAALLLITPAIPVNAGLGPATSKEAASGYDAWCGKPKNNCKIVFGNGMITVDNNHSVSFESITYITRNFKFNQWKSYDEHIFGIEYVEPGSSAPEFAEIIFANRSTADLFWRDLKRACRNCKDRDATQVEVEVKQ